jgi:hypothetical protein
LREFKGKTLSQTNKPPWGRQQGTEKPEWSGLSIWTWKSPIMIGEVWVAVSLDPKMTMRAGVSWKKAERMVEKCIEK